MPTTAERDIHDPIPPLRHVNQVVQDELTGSFARNVLDCKEGQCYFSETRSLSKTL